MNADRLDDVLIDWFHPADPPPGLAGRVLRTARDSGRLTERLMGRLAVAASPRGVTLVRQGRQARPPGGAAERLVERARAELREYLDGRRTFFSVPADLSAVPDFQRRVLEAASGIPFGEARPYLWIAARIGSPRAVRAVGTALGRNPVPLIVPCHRVRRSDGTDGGYVFGTALKTRLLALERATPVLEGASSTRIVCRVGCPHAGRVRPEHRVVFASVEDARSVGYRPCRVCRPAA
jgi:O-6-methylguanine DNA methyltransferase